MSRIGRVARLAASLLAVPLAAARCDDGCEHQVVQRARSPDGEREAVVFRSVCGLSGGTNTHVDVVRVGRPISTRRSDFAVVETDTAGMRGPRGSPAVEVRWLSANSLRISYYESAQVFRAVPSNRGLTLVYEVRWDMRARRRAAEQRTRTVARLAELQQLLADFERRHGTLPDRIQEAVPASRPALYDGWGFGFVYRKTARGYELRSRGPDQVTDTEDDLVVTGRSSTNGRVP